LTNIFNEEIAAIGQKYNSNTGYEDSPELLGFVSNLIGIGGGFF
jgi:hypothetical protein